jgi:hypothetical protein
MHWLTLITFLPIHSGFSGLCAWGVRRANPWAAFAAGLIAFLAPLFLPIQWLIPLWLYAIIIVFWLARFPNLSPAWLRNLPLSPRFWGVTMTLVAFWGLAHAWPSGEFLLGTAALVAGSIAWFTPNQG